MSPRRRWLLHAGAAAWAMGPIAAVASDDGVRPGRALAFPRDHGAHPGSRIEWWYATGWLQHGAQLFGFQLTFFRSRIAGLADALPPPRSRFDARQLLFAHAAVSDIGAGRHLHAQRIARWSGDPAYPEARAGLHDTALALGPWRLHRDASPEGSAGLGRYRARLAAPDAGFTLDLALQATQPLLLQGQAGFSQKGPSPAQASHYYSQPQLAVQAQLTIGRTQRQLSGRGWLDHEWSDALLADDAVGWDWIGINLADGGALTAFQLRRADGSVLWAGGSHRPAGGAVRAFAAHELVFSPGREWASPATGARYPVAWTVATPVGRFGVTALLDAQELDSRASTGAVYWEGLVEVRQADTDHAAGPRLGLGYLEMTGRAAPLRLGG